MGGRIAQALQVFFAALGPIGRRPAGAKRFGFLVGVDIAELATKADLESGVATGELFFGEAPDAFLGATPDRFRDFLAPAVGVEDPLLK